MPKVISTGFRNLQSVGDAWRRVYRDANLKRFKDRPQSMRMMRTMFYLGCNVGLTVCEVDAINKLVKEIDDYADAFKKG